jgi:hypothetical protein
VVVFTDNYKATFTKGWLSVETQTTAENDIHMERYCTTNWWYKAYCGRRNDMMDYQIEHYVVELAGLGEPIEGPDITPEQQINLPYCTDWELFAQEPGECRGDPDPDPDGDPEKQRQFQACQTNAIVEKTVNDNNCLKDYNSALSNVIAQAIGGGAATAAIYASLAGGTCTVAIPFFGTVACGAVAGVIGYITGFFAVRGELVESADTNYNLCSQNANILYNRDMQNCYNLLR